MPDNIDLYLLYFYDTLYLTFFKMCYLNFSLCVTFMVVLLNWNSPSVSLCITFWLSLLIEIPRVFPEGSNISCYVIVLFLVTVSDQSGFAVLGRFRIVLNYRVRVRVVNKSEFYSVAVWPAPIFVNSRLQYSLLFRRLTFITSRSWWCLIFF